jgi:nitronate monooxygenase
MRSVGATHRVWTNRAAQNCSEIEARNGTLEEILEVVSGIRAKKMYEEGDLDAGIIACGQGVGLARNLPTVQELLEGIISDAGDIVNGLQLKE